MNKFNRTKSIKNKFLFSNNPPAIIIKNNEPEIKQDIKIEDIKIEDIKIEEPKIEDIKKEEEEIKDNMYISFPNIDEIYNQNVEIIAEKNEIVIKPMKNLKLVVDEVILNLRKNKKNGWNI